MQISRRMLACASLGAVGLTASGCAASGRTSRDASNAAATAPASPSGSASANGPRPPGDAVPLEDVAMDHPAALTAATLSPDILISADSTISTSLVTAVSEVEGVDAVTVLSLAQFFNQERPVHYAAVNPEVFRRFTPPGSAQTQAIWNRVAGGEMAIRSKLGKQLEDTFGYVQMGNDRGSPLAHIGAYTPLVSRASGEPVIDAVVNEKWVRRLRMERGNALLVSTGNTAPRKVYQQLTKVLGKGATVQILAVDLEVNAKQTAVLTGGSVSSALGSVSYTANSDGTVNLDPAWVKAYIRTEEMPIIGRVTGNKIMLPELRAALSEVVARGLASKIHPSEYGGCFVPRFIAGTRTLSFHSFGTAIDLNVPGNLRGTVGEMDRTVVAIFKRWGFGWGGDWSYTDPMHFELHQLKRAG